MIDLAIIASTPHLADLSALGSIDMALTHLVLTSDQQAAYFARRAAAGVRVLLDNSAYELETITGRGMHAGPVLDAAGLIGASVVICQDVVDDGPATVTTTRRFLDQARDLASPERYQYLGVPQGTSRTEWLDSYQRLLDLPGLGLIGLSKLSVPRSFAAPVAEARLTCLEAILSLGTPPLPLHLLGGDRSLLWELRQHHQRGYDPFICGNDSSHAFWYAARDLPPDPLTGRATRDLTEKPDLEGHALASPRLAVARRTVEVLRHAAGLPSAGTVSIGPKEAQCR
ncbi:MAG: hypothetical protein JXA67_13320 [Micromonosporaceae bacterium]|nr:hypothetical protein [Micromonosporaceae bacterium]